MESLKVEAINYADRVIGFANELHSEWEACHTHIVRFCEESKYLQAEKIKAQIEIYLNCLAFIDDEEYRTIVRRRIEIGEQLLKELKD